MKNTTNQIETFNFVKMTNYYEDIIQEKTEKGEKCGDVKPYVLLMFMTLFRRHINRMASKSMIFKKSRTSILAEMKNLGCEISENQYKIICKTLQKWGILSYENGANRVQERTFCFFLSHNPTATQPLPNHNQTATQLINKEESIKVLKCLNLKSEREENSPPSQEKIFENQNSPTPNPIQASTDTEKEGGGGVRIKFIKNEQNKTSNFHTFEKSEYADKGKLITFCEEMHPNKDFSDFADNFINKHTNSEEHAKKRLNKKGWQEKILEWLKLEKKAIPEKKAPKTVTEAENFTKTLTLTQKAFDEEISKIGDMCLHSVDYDIKKVIIFTNEAEYKRVENTENTLIALGNALHTHFGLDWNIGYVLPVEEEIPTQTPNTPTPTTTHHNELNLLADVKSLAKKFSIKKAQNTLQTPQKEVLPANFFVEMYPTAEEFYKVIALSLGNGGEEIQKICAEKYQIFAKEESKSNPENWILDTKREIYKVAEIYHLTAVQAFCHENYDNALQNAEKAILLQRCYIFLETYAQILHAKGEVKVAKKVMQEAITQGKHDHANTQESQKLLKSWKK